MLTERRWIGHLPAETARTSTSFTIFEGTSEIQRMIIGMVQQAPVNLLHHTSWQVDDIDDIGRGAMAMLEKDPGRHVWGLGRHYLGSNFFWYLKDPAGNFSEYYSDMDCIVDDALWEPGVREGIKSLFSWGPPPPPSFLAPDDLAAMMPERTVRADADAPTGTPSDEFVAESRSGPTPLPGDRAREGWPYGMAGDTHAVSASGTRPALLVAPADAGWSRRRAELVLTCGGQAGIAC